MMEELCRKNPPCKIGSERHRSCVMGREPLNEIFFGFRASRLGQGLQFPSHVPLCEALSYTYRNKSTDVFSNLQLLSMHRTKHAKQTDLSEITRLASEEQEALSHLAKLLRGFPAYSEYLDYRIKKYGEDRNPNRPLFNETEVMRLLFYNNLNALKLERVSREFRTVVSDGGKVQFKKLKSLFIAESRLVTSGQRLDEEHMFEDVIAPFERE